MSNQLELFEELDVLSEEDQAKLEAMEYVAMALYRSSGHRNSIKLCLDKGNVLGAFKEFSQCYTNFGFSDGKYRFFGHLRAGQVQKVGGPEYDATSKQLSDCSFLEKEKYSIGFFVINLIICIYITIGGLICLIPTCSGIRGLARKGDEWI